MIEACQPIWQAYRTHRVFPLAPAPYNVNKKKQENRKFLYK